MPSASIGTPAALALIGEHGVVVALEGATALVLQLGNGQTLLRYESGDWDLDARPLVSPPNVPHALPFKLHVLWAKGTAGQPWAEELQFVAAAGDPYVTQHPTAYKAEMERQRQLFMEQLGPAEFVTTVEEIQVPRKDAPDG